MDLAALLHVGFSCTRDGTYVLWILGGFLSTVPPGKSMSLLLDMKHWMIWIHWGVKTLRKKYIYTYACVCVCMCVCTHTHNLVLGRVLSVHISFLEMPSLIVLWILPSFAVSWISIYSSHDKYIENFSAERYKKLLRASEEWGWVHTLHRKWLSNTPASCTNLRSYHSLIRGLNSRGDSDGFGRWDRMVGWKTEDEFKTSKEFSPENNLAKQNQPTSPSRFFNPI